MYGTLWSLPGGVASDLARLRRNLDDVFGTVGLPSGIRSVATGAFPAINVGQTPTSVEVDVFAPGMDAAKFDVVIDRGVLTISGERASALPPQQPGDKRSSVYSRERSSGAFKRAVSLPDDVDATRVNASYRDGVLKVSIARRESTQPQRITVQ